MPDKARPLADSLIAARAGSLEALGQTLDMFRGYLLAIAERELDPQLQAKGGASDLVQETLVEALRDFGRFHGDSEGELKAWLRHLLVHNLIDFTRHYRHAEKRGIEREQGQPNGESSIDTKRGLADSGPSPSEDAIAIEQAHAIQQALEKLPEDYRRVIQLRYQEEQSFQDIGRQMNLTPNAARKLWVRAIKRLRQESEGRDESGG